MKPTITTCTHKARLVVAFLATAAIAPQAATSQETNHTTPNIPVIQMDRVPLTDAINNLARQTGRNFILDPRLSRPWLGAEGTPSREPSVTARWENVSAEQALDRLLKEQGLTIVVNPATTIDRIAFTNQAVKPIPASQVGYATGTNSVIPLIVMDSVPLTDAIKNLARHGQLDLSLDPALPLPLTGPVTRTVSEYTVSIRWEKVTIQQALAALLDNYNLAMVQDPATASAKILPKAAANPATKTTNP